MAEAQIKLGVEIESELRNRGADFVFFTDISHSNQIVEDEFNATESKTDQLADVMVDYLTLKGYSAFSQSENNLYSTGSYNESTKTSTLPHKTIAIMAGLGWIGKHNLLVSSESGSAISMCTVLTDAPLKTVSHPPASPECGECTVCRDICPVQVIKGTTWSMGIARDELVDVYRCTMCLKCLALCPWTQNYLERKQMK